MKTIVPADNSRGSGPQRYERALQRAKKPRSTDAWRTGEHNHSWRPIGAHTLHAGHKSKGENPYPETRMPVREVRRVFLCQFCPEVRVKISRHLVYKAMQDVKTNPSA